MNRPQRQKPPRLSAAKLVLIVIAPNSQIGSPSHHAIAMQTATTQSVLAAMPATIQQTQIDGQAGNTSTRFHATLDGEAFELTHTFGAYPLQQYLVATERGRMQTLRESWDSRPEEEGGQRWYLQYPDMDIPKGDVLHWSGINQNWNSMCADCHSTFVKKNYNAVDDFFDTTYAELTVGCEACHGPGSAHIDDPSIALSGSADLASPKQAQICATCHSRRTQIAEGYTAGAELMDHYVPALLNTPIYTSDGRIDDEAYVYSSFLSSKMHAQGVTCNDCHNAHTGELHVQGDGVCMQCHSQSGNPRFSSLTLADYQAPAHHLHANQSEGARCVACHMPAKTYMGVDVRHDHSLRVPAQETCTQCHTEEQQNLFSQQGVFAAMQKRLQPWASHFSHAWRMNPITAESELTRLANSETLSAMVRATSLSRLGNSRNAGTTRAVEQATRNQDPLLRHASASLLDRLAPTRQLGALKRLLKDDVKAVRIAAANAALQLTELDQRTPLQPSLDHAVDEAIASQLLNAERAEANVNLAITHLQLQRSDAQTKAAAYLRRALEINPQFVPALLNYADLLRAQDADAEAESYLIRAVNSEVVLPEADAAYAMWLVRNGARELALMHLKRAYVTQPENPQWLYTYAVALHSLGQGTVAVGLLREISHTPIYRDEVKFLHASIARDLIPQDAVYLQEAREIVDVLLQNAPSNRNYQALAQDLARLAAPQLQPQ